MKLKLFLLLFLGLLGSGTAMAQFTSEPLDAAQVKRYIETQPQHRLSFINGEKGTMLCKDALVMKQFLGFAEQEHATTTEPAPTIESLDNPEVRPASVTTANSANTNADRNQRMKELMRLMDSDPANAAQYTQELKQLQSSGARDN